MAAFAVVFDGTRVANADVLTNWISEGATPTSDADIFYQGTASVSGKVKKSEVGFFQNSATQDLSTTPGTWIPKFFMSTQNALDGVGLVLRIGSGASNTAFYQYDLFTASTYPVAGGWQIHPIDPNVVQFRSSTTGVPVLTAVASSVVT